MANIVVTGANRGLGLEFVRQHVAHGDTVIATVREPARAADLRALAAESGGRLHVLEMAVDSPASTARAAALAGKLVDGVDRLVNNAGIYPNENLATVGAEAFARAFATNAAGPVFVTRSFGPLLERGRRPLVANISSRLGSIATMSRDPWGDPAYNASKAALDMLTVLLARELKPKRIAVVALSPGWVRTDMGGPDADLSPEESVGAMRRLLDRLGITHTGTFLALDGSTVPW